MSNPRTTDLNEPASPEGVPDVLRYAAEKMYEQAAELRSAWQSGTAGDPWTMIAVELERAADRIKRKL